MSAIEQFTGSAPRILAGARILAGIMFACHGAQKVFGVFGGVPPTAPALIIWTSGPIELIGGILIALGLFTRSAAFLSSGLMAVAYFMAHAPKSFFPIVNGGDSAVQFCFVFLYLVFAGAGAWSLDAKRGA